MNSIYDIYESILDDIETSMNRGTNDVIIDMIFDKNENKKQYGFEQLLTMVESYHPKQHKTTAKMKSSDSYFVEFARPIDIENGELTNIILDSISYIQICKRIESSNYRTVCISSVDGWVNSVYELSWKYVQSNFNPKASNVKLYEVPEELNGLFERILIEANKHR